MELAGSKTILVIRARAERILGVSVENTFPVASVILTTFNGGAYLRETLEAILKQTFTDFELIVIDDGSIDDSVAIVKSYSDRRIRHFQNAQNLGISHTRNRGLELSRGEFIFAIDQDDICLPTRLERQIAFMRANPGMVMVASSAKEWRNGKLRSFYKAEVRPHILHWRLFSRCGIVHSSVCMRASIIKDYKLSYEQIYHYAEDFVLFHKLAEHGQITILADELVIYREHDNNASARHNEEMEANGCRFLREQFYSYLGLEIDADAAELFWSAFVQGKPIHQAEKIRQVGEIYFKALQYFFKIKNFSVQQKQEISDFAVADWWSMVCRNVKATGRLSLLLEFKKVAKCKSHFLSWTDVVDCFLHSIFKYLKNTVV
jgi:glycosyltransferase involved in cell wall biosynthesis